MLALLSAVITQNGAFMALPVAAMITVFVKQYSRRYPWSTARDKRAVAQAEMEEECRVR
jgi:hypothetical protein